MTDTIAAIATAPGRGGICIIRVSGDKSSEAAKKIANLANIKPRFAYFRSFKDENETIDEGVALFYKAPHSYTGEDVLELQGHGGNVVPQQILKAVLKIPGIRQAEPGEFTKRAFLNGKMDLTAAEAVEDLISSGSQRAAKAALSSLDGAFKSHIDKLLDGLTNFRVHLEACLDFPEEHEDFFESTKAVSELGLLIAHCKEALHTAHCGVLLNEGARIVLAGSPNAGKSSLLNALAGQDRAIVTPIPGTTRDVLQINIEIGGIPVTMTDTAGIRDNPGDEIEALGIARAVDELKKADLVLLMIDGSQKTGEERMILERITKLTEDHPNLLIVVSKSDLPRDDATTALLETDLFKPFEKISCSTKVSGGLDKLKAKLQEALGVIPEQGVFSARLRHVKELQETLKALEMALSQLDFGDLVLCAREVGIAQNHLGLITGKVTSDDILGKIFASFCIGK